MCIVCALYHEHCFFLLVLEFSIIFFIRSSKRTKNCMNKHWLKFIAIILSITCFCSLRWLDYQMKIGREKELMSGSFFHEDIYLAYV